MQDEIVARLANALNAQLAAAEARRAEQAPNPNSMDLYFQGLSWFHRGRTLSHVAQARGFFDRALAADPDNVDALIGSAAADIADGGNSFVADPTAAFAAAEAKLTEGPVVVPGPCSRPCVSRLRQDSDEARRRGHRRMRACVDAGSQSRRRPCLHRTWQDLYRSRRGSRGSHRPGAALEPTRYVGLCLVDRGGHREKSLGRLRTSRLVVSPSDRSQSKLSRGSFPLGRRPRAARPTRRGAFRGQAPASRSTRPSPSPARGSTGPR